MLNLSHHLWWWSLTEISKGKTESAKVHKSATIQELIEAINIRYDWPSKKESNLFAKGKTQPLPRETTIGSLNLAGGTTIIYKELQISYLKDYYSTFISYSHKNQDLAEELHNDESFA